VSRRPGVPRAVLRWGFGALIAALAIVAVVLLLTGPSLPPDVVAR